MLRLSVSDEHLEALPLYLIALIYAAALVTLAVQS